MSTGAQQNDWYQMSQFPLGVDLMPLVDYLRRMGVIHRVSESDNSQVLWLIHPTDRALVQAFFDSGGLEQPSEGARLPRRSGTPPWMAALLLMDRYPVTLLTIYFGILGALLVAIDSRWEWIRYFTFLGFEGAPTAQSWMSLGQEQASGHWWRLITPVFLHFGVFHILFNGLWIWEFGRRIERYYGSLPTFGLLLVLALSSNVAQYLWSGATLFGGLSGVVYGLMGYLWMIQRFCPRPELAVPPGIIGFMLFWQALCLFGVIDYFIDGGIANGAHMGGLAVGMIVGFLYSRRHQSR